MDAAALIVRMDAQRTAWADLPDGKRVQFRRPLETQLSSMRGGITVDHLCEYVCGWEGFTEADLITSGASDPVPFDAVLWGRVVRDRIDYLAVVAEAIATAVSTHIEAKEARAKNSKPS